MLFIVALFLVKATVVRRFNKNKAAKHRALAELTHRHARKLIKLFRVNISLTGTNELSNNTPCLIISNHLSYVDILILAAIRPTLFLSHKGIEREPVIGSITACGGTLFVDKSSKTKLAGEMEHLAGMLKEGNTMTLFPEGASGNGLAVMPFHSAFIEAAMRAEAPVIPICLQYLRINETPLTKENKDFIFIYDKTPFLPHIWKLLKKLNSLDVTVKVFDRISTAGGNRKEISGRAREEIVREFMPV